MPDGLRLGQFSVCATIEKEEDDEDDLEQRGQLALEQTPPELFTNRDITYKSGGLEEFSIEYSDGELEVPDWPITRNFIETDFIADEPKFHVHSWTFESDWREVIPFQDDLLTHTDSFSVKYQTYAFLSESDETTLSDFFDESILSIENGDTVRIDISIDDWDLTFDGHREQFMVYVSDTGTMTVETGNLTDTIESKIEEAEDMVQEVLS
jgi:hypothetical protein